MDVSLLVLSTVLHGIITSYVHYRTLQSLNFFVVFLIAIACFLHKLKSVVRLLSGARIFGQRFNSPLYMEKVCLWAHCPLEAMSTPLIIE